MAASTCAKFVACKISHFHQHRSPFLLTCIRLAPSVMQQQVAHSSSKHYDIKWRKHRREKFLKIDLPDFDQSRKEEKMTPDEMRMKMKKEGVLPPRSFMERPLNVTCTGAIFEQFIPPEGDGKSSAISKEGAKQRLTELEKRGKSYMELRKIRKYEENFDTKEFAQQAQQIYIESHKMLEDFKQNEDELHDRITEKAYPEMMLGMELKSLRWNFIESLEPPRVVHVRTTDFMSKENLYAQVTVRMHTKQTLAIYDRFGRLMFGSESIVRDVLEYVVFEKHIVNIYGLWRIHGKIIPDWMPPRDPLIKSYRKPHIEPIEEQKSAIEAVQTDHGEEPVQRGLATA